MRSELQYFMHPDDHSEFDKFLSTIDDIKVVCGKSYDEICMGEGFIQYQRSEFSDSLLTSGRIAIASTDLDGNLNYKNHKEIESLYKKIRNWIKKRSINSLVCYNEKLGLETKQNVKNFWLGKNAELWLKTGGKLKQFKSGFVVFDLAKQP